MEYAPIVLFVYNRPNHVARVIDALKLNKLACESDLIIYSDAAKKDSDLDAVAEVRTYIHKVDGFKSVTVIERGENMGLARSIIDGVTTVCEKYGKVIVMEDDIVTSPDFLTFMNRALHHYVDEKRVWHISGWNYPIDSTDIGDAFLWRVMNCWGWATWHDRWKYFEKDSQKLILSWDQNKINRFNLDCVKDSWSQVRSNATGDISTWAVFWYATIFEYGGLCLNPTKTFVHNIGHDGTGEHCGNTSIYEGKEFSSLFHEFPYIYVENSLATSRIKQFYSKHNPSFYRIFLSKVKRRLLSKWTS
ncbi:glycosyltransferase family 2 protein [Methylobacillus sp. Pita2]|uniref:glycosyltransferase family 2 protein n=1 Tax=Methylobacillus sp. Pita2 TaxID=3383245 RepID=UPI0038B4431F